MFDLSGQTAVVTGGNGGIGLAMARGLAKSGADIAIWSRNAEKNAAALEGLRSCGIQAESFVCEVHEEDQVTAATRKTVERFGRIDSCFANAGTGIARPFLETTLSDWDRVQDVNLRGVFLTFREVVAHMVSRGGGGKLIGVASVGAIHGMPRQASYSASKAGLCALIRSLAVEFARHNIQANAILPGWVETDMTETVRSWEKLNTTVIKRTPAHRWGKPEDFEGAAVYLASSASNFHTGDVLRIDGGYTIF